jgi:hypothetical protein
MLEAIAALAAELGRGPTNHELAARMGRRPSNVSKAVYTARAQGLIVPHLPERRARERTPIRLTAGARIALGLPVICYLAWPLPAPTSPAPSHYAAWQAGMELARIALIQVPGAVPVSPYLVRHGAADRAKLDAAAIALAAMSDAVIVYRDGLLIGRRDVDAARLNGAHIAVMGDAEIGAEDPWAAAMVADSERR